jgi:hypothetical protein
MVHMVCNRILMGEFLSARARLKLDSKGGSVEEADDGIETVGNSASWKTYLM